MRVIFGNSERGEFIFSKLINLKITNYKAWWFMKALFFGLLLIFAFFELNLGLAFSTHISWANFIVSALFFVCWQVSIAVRWNYALNLRTQMHGIVNPSLLFSLIRILWLGNLVSISLIPSFLGQDTLKILKWKEVTEKPADLFYSVVSTRIAGLFGVLVWGILCLYFTVAGEIIAFHIQIITKILSIKLFFGLIVFFLIVLCGFIFVLSKLNLIKKIKHFCLNLDSTLLLMGIGSQCLFICSAVFAMKAVGDITFFSGYAIAATAALARVVPLIILGVTLGEAAQIYLLTLIGWEISQSTAATILIIIFHFGTAIAGFFLETMRNICFSRWIEFGFKKSK